MHRSVKGLLSLMMVFVMTTTAVCPVRAEKLSQESPETEQIQTEPGLVEQPATETQMTQTASETEVQAAEETAAEEQLTEEEPLTETQEEPEVEMVKLEVVEFSAVEEVQVASTGDAVSDPYDSLTSEQKQFHVYAGTQPIKPLSEVLDEDPNDILARLKFLDGGVIPDSENMPAQSGAIVKQILDGREGDARFYRLSEWNLWSVRDDGVPIAVDGNAGATALGNLATMENFKRCAFLDIKGTAADPEITLHKPILEPVWSCIDYAIPVYDAQGQNTGLTVTVNAENYSDPSKVAFPDVEADVWKLVYGSLECQLNSAGEIWTNTTNGIGTVGRDFDAGNAKLQAFKLSAPEGTKYEVVSER